MGFGVKGTQVRTLTLLLFTDVTLGKLVIFHMPPTPKKKGERIIELLEEFSEIIHGRILVQSGLANTQSVFVAVTMIQCNCLGFTWNLNVITLEWLSK